MNSRKFLATLKNSCTRITLAVSLFVAGCTTQASKTMTVGEGCETICKVINATKIHAIALDPGYFKERILHSVTNNRGVWEVRYEIQPPPNMLVVGGGVVFLVDGKTLAVIDMRGEQ